MPTSHKFDLDYGKLEALAGDIVLSPKDFDKVTDTLKEMRMKKKGANGKKKKKKKGKASKKKSSTIGSKRVMLWTRQVAINLQLR